MSVDTQKPSTPATSDRVQIASGAPIQKVTYGAIAGAITTILVWGLSLLKVDVPVPVAQAFTVVVTALVAYFTPLRKSEIVVPATA